MGSHDVSTQDIINLILLFRTEINGDEADQVICEAKFGEIDIIEKILALLGFINIQ